MDVPFNDLNLHTRALLRSSAKGLGCRSGDDYCWQLFVVVEDELLNCLGGDALL